MNDENIKEQIRSMILNANIDIKSKSKDELLRMFSEYKGIIDQCNYMIVTQVFEQLYDEMH